MMVLVSLSSLNSLLTNTASKKWQEYDTIKIAFPFSTNGRLSVEAETFLDDFQKMVHEKTMKRFDIFYGVHGFNLPLLIDYHGFSIELEKL
ncbi:hypothetical protein P9112_003078 [Eukaryota sp. TZLM1-RC]